MADALRSAVLAGLVLGLGGCARRLDLTPSEFERLSAVDPDHENLRVYPRRKLISDYPQLTDDVTRDVTRRKVVERGVRQPLERTVARPTPGKILAIDTLNGATRFWVAFFSECKDVSCAYGFVQTENQRYSLVSVPPREGYKEPASYRRNRLKRNKLRLMRLRSLVEVNEVLAARRRLGKKSKGKPIDLQIRKDRWRPTRKQRQRADGVR